MIHNCDKCSIQHGNHVDCIEDLGLVIRSGTCLQAKIPESMMISKEDQQIQGSCVQYREERRKFEY